MSRVTVAALLALLLTAGPLFAQPDTSLSPVAQQILGKLKARSDINTVCKNDDALRTAVRETVRDMVMSGQVEGRPVEDARAAGRYVKEHCGSL